MHTHRDKVKWASQRDSAVDLAKKKDPSSLNVAMTIIDPWYKCQALSIIAAAFDGEMRFIANEVMDENVKKLIDKAVSKNQKYLPRKFVGDFIKF